VETTTQYCCGGSTIHQDAANAAATAAVPQAQQVEYPQVRYYCLTSSAGCYTDFHVDLAARRSGTISCRVKSCFASCRPTFANLIAYEDWLPFESSDNVLSVTTVICQICNRIRISANSSGLVSLKANQTLLIPWMDPRRTRPKIRLSLGKLFARSRYTASNKHSFLEVRTRVPDRFRFPLFR
jgi:F-box/leucine-rich repeat protein 10/11